MAPLPFSVACCQNVSHISLLLPEKVTEFKYILVGFDELFG